MQEPRHAITYRIGTHRIRSPEETLSKVMPYMDKMGITRIADVTGLDTIGIPVVMVCRPNSRSVSVSQGKGSTLAAAKASGLMESVEGYHAENITKPLRISSYEDLLQSCEANDVVVGPQSLPEIKGAKYHPHYPITWIASRNLMGCGTHWLPYEVVHTNYTYPRPSGSGCFPASSNGLASGNDVTEATVHGICEVVERDAISLWHLMEAVDLDNTSIDPGSINNALCLETLKKLDDADQDSYIWDITSDTGIPTYFAVIMDRRSHTRHIGVGSGTHLSREVALLRALHEAVQVRTTYIVGARDDITPDEYTSDGIELKRGFFQNKISQCRFKGAFSRTLDLDTDTVEEDLVTVLNRLQEVSINSVLCVDISKPQFDIAVVRVVIPGLEAPHDEDNYMPGFRAKKMMQGHHR